MPFDDDGFVPRTAAQIIADYEEKAKNIFDVVNFSPSSLLWQQMKIHAIDEFYYETIIQTCSEQLSIYNAVGVWLDRHGIENGMPRRGATHAQGYVDATVELAGADVTIGQNAEFKSSLNSYLSDDETVIEFRIEQTKTKTGESFDYFSSDYPYAEDVSQILDESLNPISPTYWEFDTTYHNNIHWLAASSGVIEKNENYYVVFSGDWIVIIGIVISSSGPKILNEVIFP